MLPALLALAVLAPQGKSNPLDAWFEAEWKRLDAKPSGPSDDATFLRRLSLDLTGALRSPNEIRKFVRLRRKTKRAKKIDELISSPEAADYFAHLWVQWLTGHEIGFQDAARLDVGALVRWLKKAWEEDLSYDAMVRMLLTSTGDVGENPAANFRARYLVPGEPPSALASATARLFLGRDIQCAQCHDHPYDNLAQEEFWGFAGFFRPLSYRRRVLRSGPFRRPLSMREDFGEQVEPPRFLDGRVPGPDETLDDGLARLVLSMEGDAAARAIVDRVWKIFFGRSIGKRRSGLLDLLVSGFKKDGWSLRGLVKRIVSSRAYELSSEGTEEARAQYAVGPLKMMNTVQFLRGYMNALQLGEYYRRMHEKDPRRASFFNDPDAFWVGQSMFAKEMIFPKGRNPEEVLATGTDRLALKLMNNRDIQLLMVAKFPATKQRGLLQQAMRKSARAELRIEELFLMLIGRLPTRDEKIRLVDHVRSIRNPVHAYADVFWMLFNSSEFIFVG